ncbi:cysteine desulfurase family protein [Oceanicella actignis]|uniref:cysteine desulfurase family protein n=1 Tax=Oceanicella actignis TaxID=1189325 RepID=UPI0011E728CE|nr:aminotransferase class V-fold PLP-dependent enzyme [Oceanicella actignis]TYO88491.1 cysteine desulfurase [Oceanicella actignis]
MSARRVYLDWNASAPLRPEARAAMLAALDLCGNPSSVHAEGRAARAAIERARRQVAALAGCAPEEVVFTSGATEAARIMLRGRRALAFADVEHDSVHAEAVACAAPARLGVEAGGRVRLEDAPEGAPATLQLANSETGVMQPAARRAPLLLCDATQAAGKTALDFAAMGARALMLSAHKIGGPKGVGALIVRAGAGVDFGPAGGGQELRRRPGTENVPGIAGFGAAAEAALRDLEAGVWARVERLRDMIEERLEKASPETIFPGRGSPRLPNTTCAVTPGWKGETQVMQLDLAGFAVSAGSACASGKTAPSRALAAMGLAPELARCALRVSLGPDTREDEALAFAEAWAELRRRRRSASAA